MSINEKKIENILKMLPEQRYQYFIRKVTDFEEIWGLFNNGWATSEFMGKHIVPFWPEEIFAKFCATDLWSSYEPKKINLDEFLKNWISGMLKDNLNSLIFPIPKGEGTVVHIEVLEKDLLEELKQYN